MDNIDNDQNSHSSIEKGVIDRNGYLRVQRNAKLKFACCPFSSTSVTTPNGNEKVINRGCGDWCVLFKEPTPSGSEGAFIDICRGETVEIQKFRDERNYKTQLYDDDSQNE